MQKQKPPFTWHYYLMALGILGAMLALTLAAWGAAVSGVGFAVLSHPQIHFSGPTRFILLSIFIAMYVIGFPEAEVVRAIMASD